MREERLAEERSLRSQEREVRRKKEYYRRQEEARLLKIREEEEARKLEGLLSVICLLLCFLVFVRIFISCKTSCWWRLSKFSHVQVLCHFEHLGLST